MKRLNDYLRVKEVAATLAVSEQTIRNMVKNGALESIRIGKCGIRILRKSVEAFTGKNEEREDNNNDNAKN